MLDRLGRALWEEHGGIPYLTGFLVRLDLDARSLFWVNAGHPAALPRPGPAPVPLEPRRPGPPARTRTRDEADDGSRRGRARAGDRRRDRGDRVAAGGSRSGSPGRSRRSAEGPQAVCERVMRLAASGRGPVGVTGWSDDRTVVVVTLRRRRRGARGIQPASAIPRVLGSQASPDTGPPRWLGPVHRKMKEDSRPPCQPASPRNPGSERRPPRGGRREPLVMAPGSGSCRCSTRRPARRRSRFVRRLHLDPARHYPRVFMEAARG